MFIQESQRNCYLNNFGHRSHYASKIQKTSSISLLELCENDEWNIIIDSMPSMIHVWNFEEKNSDGNNPLHICCAKGSLEVLQHFNQLLTLFGLNFKNTTGRLGASCVLLASMNGQLETLKWLIENGSSMEDRDNNGCSCVLLAAKNGHLETIKWLIENGSSIRDVDYYGGSCVLLAARFGHVETVQWLIENGSSMEERDYNGYSCVLHAAKNGHLNTVKWLVENGSLTNERDSNGNSCVLLAARFGHLETVQWLIENGSSVEERNNFHSNCILQASKLGDIETIKWLLTKGCSLLDKNNIGTCAMNANEFQAVTWMLANGSSINEDTVKISSCEQMLKRNGIYNQVVGIVKQKSANKSKKNEIEKPDAKQSNNDFL